MDPVEEGVIAARLKQVSHPGVQRTGFTGGGIRRQHKGQNSIATIIIRWINEPQRASLPP